MPGIQVVQATGRAARSQTTGMLLEEAFAGDGYWVGQVRTPPGSTGGWHHHGDHDTHTFVAEGRARFEWGRLIDDAFEVKPGDFLHIPPRVVHREINPGPAPNLLIIFRRGSGPTLVASAAP